MPGSTVCCGEPSNFGQPCMWSVFTSIYRPWILRSQKYCITIVNFLGKKVSPVVQSTNCIQSSNCNLQLLETTELIYQVPIAGYAAFQKLKVRVPAVVMRSDIGKLGKVYGLHTDLPQQSFYRAVSMVVQQQFPLCQQGARIVYKGKDTTMNV